jgi:hypothetical protein
MIDAEIGRKNHGSIPPNCNREGAGTELTPNQIKLVPKTTYKKKLI